ncbi:GntR family transcriptional regulator [Roseibium sp. AS2]|uniref:GntR family transcriptional regulator n=1 Tax=Roseibium sp. AS2 TaxID=3135781 RepID=UPI00317614E3
MVHLKQAGDRRPLVDEIYDYLHEEIASMRLKPGDRISEADIAARFGVSRQPVRDAFSRLENQDLLLIRPQRATEVKRFSAREIEKSRFVRAAVEAEVLRRAAAKCDRVGAAMLEDCLDRQRQAIADNDYEAFGALDYAFHRTLCQIARLDFAFEVISSEKAKVDRLCILGLSKEDRMPQLVADHEEIVACVKEGDAERAVVAGMRHLSRLDATIESITATNESFFEESPG